MTTSKRTKDGSHRVILRHVPDLVVVVGSREGLEAVGIELAARRVQFLAVVLRQFRAERVDRDDKCSAIGLKLE